MGSFSITRFILGTDYILIGIAIGYALDGFDTSRTSEIAGIFGDIGSFLAAPFAFIGFLLLLKQVKAQREELQIVKRESDLNILQTLSLSKDQELARRAEYLLSKKALNFTLINKDTSSIKKLGPRLCFRRTGDQFHGPTVELDIAELESLEDKYLEDRYPLEIDEVMLYKQVHEPYAKIIFHGAHMVNGDEWKQSGFFINVLGYNGYGDFDLSITIPLNSKEILSLKESESFYDTLRYFDYPSGRKLSQRYQIYCMARDQNKVRISISLDKDLTVLPPEHNNWMIDPTDIYELDSHGFPE